MDPASDPDQTDLEICTVSTTWKTHQTRAALIDNVFIAVACHKLEEEELEEESEEEDSAEDESGEDKSVEESETSATNHQHTAATRPAK